MPPLLKPQFFPPPELIDPEGVVLFGGQLTPEWLIDAYTHGIFPWPIFEGTDLLLWWSPDPRAIFELNDFHASRRLQRTDRSGKFAVTCDRNFAGVIQGCAENRQGGTWLTPPMIAAYKKMHELGHAHSVEVWHEEKLVGGTYGLAIGGLYAGESMFHRERDASKVALLHLVEHLQARGYTLFDIQQLTPHTQSLGAIEISRSEYLQRVVQAVREPVTWA